MLNFFKKKFNQNNKNTVANHNFESVYRVYDNIYNTHENRSDFPYELQCKIFTDNLTLTKAYFDLQLKDNAQPVALALRSFNPIINNKTLFEFEQCENPFSKLQQIAVKWTTDPLDKNLVPELLEQQLIYKSNIVSALDDVEPINGKILIADFDETVVDGASEVCSEYLIDVYDLPPIDTWFYLNRNENGWRRIYAWIPAPFLPLVDEAIAVNCVDCLHWLKEN